MELNKIYNMDCLKGMREMPDNCVDLVVTDPPYVIETSGAGIYKQTDLLSMFGFVERVGGTKSAPVWKAIKTQQNT